MKLLIIRHGEAENREAFAKTCPDDGLRPLTRSGRKRMKKAASGLKTIAPTVDSLVSSPLMRALETAEILAETFDVKVTQIGELAPSRRVSGVLKWLQKQQADATVILVGHEPQLGLLASWLMTGLDEPIMELKKGSACLLEFTDEVRSGRAMLRWALTARQLRRLRD